MKYTTLFISLVLAFSMNAQAPFYYKIDNHNGLPSDEVYEVIQDDFGYIWIGCDAGLFRYDGIHFKRFQNKEGSGRSISHFEKDKSGRIWCQNFSGQIFYIENDSLHLFRDFSSSTRSFPPYTLDVENNIIYVAQDTFFTGYDITTKDEVFSVRKIPAKNGSYYESRMLTFFEDQLITGFSNNQHKLDIQTQQIKKISGSVIFEKHFIIDNQFFLTHISNQKNQHSISQLKNQEFHTLNIFSRETFANYIFMIKPIRGMYAVCTSSGVKLMDKHFQNIIKTLLPYEKISDIFEDREGNIWLTSLQNGVYIIPSLELETYLSSFFPNSNITALGQHNGRLAIGTYSGTVIQLDTKNNTFTTQKKKKKAEYRAVKDFLEFNGRWFVARGELVTIDDKNIETRVHITSNVRGFAAMNDTIFTIDPARVLKLNIEQQSSTVINRKAGRAITSHPFEDIIYFATKAGFFEYKNGRSTEILYKGATIYPTSLAWQNDTLWIGTISEGLYTFKNGIMISHMPHDAQLKGTTIRKLYTYKRQLLISSDNGLSIMDFDTRNIKAFDATDGLLQKEINDIEVIDDMVYLGTIRGLVRFPLDMNANNNTIPNINITKLIVNNNTRDLTPSSIFPYNENNVTFHFQTALMRSRGLFYYKYRLLGLDDTWKTTNASTPNVNFTSLPYGEYTFEVKAVNEDGIESDVSTFDFTISTPIWARWWFILLSLVLLASLTYWLVQRRIRNIQKQAFIENELKNTQLTAIKAQMNPHFLYNALNSIQDLILQKEVKGASKYLTKFSLLMRKVLEASGNIAVSLENEVEILRLYLQLEQLRFGDDFKYQLTLPEERDLETIQIPSMIIQPFVENAIKHGLLHKMEGERRLDINFTINGLVVCTIEDNGVGRVHSEKIKARRGIQAKSFATSATQRRLEILNQTHDNKIGLEIIDLHIDGKASGTKVILQIPILK